MPAKDIYLGFPGLIARSFNLHVSEPVSHKAAKHRLVIPYTHYIDLFIFSYLGISIGLWKRWNEFDWTRLY